MKPTIKCIVDKPKYDGRWWVRVGYWHTTNGDRSDRPHTWMQVSVQRFFRADQEADARAWAEAQKPRVEAAWAALTGDAAREWRPKK